MSTMPEESYLILHKVRGEPAFDIAINIGGEEDEMWIIPTSGHRAYPLRYWSLGKMTYVCCIDPKTEWAIGDTDTLPDHYQIHTDLQKHGSRVKELLAKLGLGKRKGPNIGLRPL